jgi:hypothetical protein
MPTTHQRLTTALTDEEISLLLAGKKLANEDQLAYLLSTTKGHVRKLRYARKIPWTILGHRSLRFSVPKVLKALESLEIRQVI